MAKTSQRYPRKELEPIAYNLAVNSRKLPYVEDSMVGGSYRRMKPDVGDLELAILFNKSVDRLIAVNLLMRALGIQKEASGERQISGSIPFQAGRLPIQVWTVDSPEDWAGMQLFVTGSSEMNIQLRSKAKRLGMKLNQYGLFLLNGEKVETKSERDIFRILGVPYLEPSKRSIAKPSSDNIPEVVAKMLRISDYYRDNGEKYKSKAYSTAAQKLVEVIDKPYEWSRVLGPSTGRDAIEIYRTGTCDRLKLATKTTPNNLPT